MAVESIDGGGGYIITGVRDIALLRLNMLVRGLRVELRGMRLTRGRTCYALLKEEYGFKGNKQRVLVQALRLQEQTEARRASTPDNKQIIVPETPPNVE